MLSEPDVGDKAPTILDPKPETQPQVALKTSALEEKETACNMLVCYFAELQAPQNPTP